MPNPLLPAVGFSHYHMLTPDADQPTEGVGPRSLAFQVVGVSNTNPVTFDLTRELETFQTRNIQAVYIDNSGNANDLVLTNLEMSPPFSVIARANKQAMLPFFGTSFGSLKVTTSNASAQTINLHFLNTPQPYAQW